MKKLIFGGVALVIVAVAGFFVYQSMQPEKIYPKKNLGTEQIVKNNTGELKGLAVENAGYYDLEKIGNTGYETVGTYFSKGEEVYLEANSEQKLVPAKLESVKVSDGKFELKKSGSYFSGIQIPEGKYSVTYEGAFTPFAGKEGTSEGRASLNIATLITKKDLDSSTNNVQGHHYSKAGYQFKKDKKTEEITVGKDEEIRIKTTDKNFKFVLTKK